jgi:nitrate reductase NapAB chaperone NapD
MALIIDSSTGTVLTAHTCVLVEDDALSEAELEALDTMTDCEVGEIARERGKTICTIPLEHHHKLNEALEETESLLHSISEALWGEDADKEWNADTLDAIADAIRRERPDLAN